jgi:hypothetical protein
LEQQIAERRNADLREREEERREGKKIMWVQEQFFSGNCGI